MKIIEPEQINTTLSFPILIDALKQAFATPFFMPQRQVFELEKSGIHPEAFAVLPASDNHLIGVKVFTYFPGNADKGINSLYSKILLFKRQTGEPLALVDGSVITYWRTAAVSALASQLLSREDSRKLLLCGTGNLARPLIRAHLSVRPISHVSVWGRHSEKAEAIIADMRDEFPEIKFQLVTDLKSSAQQADVICCATGSPDPIILGDWIKPGAHIDLLGNHSHDRRECDSNLVRKAKLFVDSRSNVLNEAGDLLIPISEGVISEKDVGDELADLCRKSLAGEAAFRSKQDITLFKSVGTALSDVVAAGLCLRS